MPANPPPTREEFDYSVRILRMNGGPLDEVRNAVIAANAYADRLEAKVKNLQNRLAAEKQSFKGYTDDLEQQLEDMEIRMLRAELKECVNCDDDGISYSDEESPCSWGCRAKRQRLAEFEGRKT